MNNPTDTTRPGEAGVKNRPTWLPRPCPRWCGWTDMHQEHDHYGDRTHSGSIVAPVVLTAVEDREVDGDDEPDQVRMFLLQHYREVEPRIELARDDRPVDIQLTLDEGELFAARLLETVLTARDEDDVVLVEGCPAWCREHHDDGHLVTVLSGPARAVMALWPGRAPDVTVDVPSDAVMDVTEVEDLARTLLALAVAARRNAPVEQLT